MRAEAKAWKVQFGRNMNAKYLALMDKIMELVEDYSKRLSRPIQDLDDVRLAMATLKEIRENEIFIDSSLDPIEVTNKLTRHYVMNLVVIILFSQESYGLMMKYQITVAKEETENVDTMRFAWEKLNSLAVSTIINS